MGIVYCPVFQRQRGRHGHPTECGHRSLPRSSGDSHDALGTRRRLELLCGQDAADLRGGGVAMNVAIFTDNDFGKVNGVTTTLRAVLEYAPAHIRPRIYTCERRGCDRPNYLALRAFGV